MASQGGPPPDWPKGYPFVAMRDFNLGRSDPHTLELRKGDEGVVYAFTDDGNYARVELPRMPKGDPNRRGYVPVNRITIGRTRKYGDIVWAGDIPI